jgi:cytochrome c oxidase subunit 3
LNAELIEHEKKTAIQGMWVFIGSEVLFFGALFLALAVYRGLFPREFAAGTRHMNLWIGTANTAVLLTSSWTLAMALEKIKRGERFLSLLNATILLGIVFLALKSYEYFQHYQEGLVPGLRWTSDLGPSSRLILFFFLYFFMTALHGLHVLIGLALISWLVFQLRKSPWVRNHEGFIENVGLYWHFVDIVWVFLFPMLYLVGRS